MSNFVLTAYIFLVVCFKNAIVHYVYFDHSDFDIWAVSRIKGP